MSKRLSKEELESDPLIEKYNRIVGFYQQNKNTILTAFIALVVLTGSLIGYKYYSENQEQKAQQFLATAETYYAQGDFESALNGNEMELSYGFLQISDEFSGTNAGNLATYYAGVSYYKLGDIEQAITYVNEYDIPKGILGVGPLSLLGNLYEANGSYEKAAETYMKAANWDENESTTPYNLMKAAYAYLDAGNEDKASELSGRIISEYSNSPELTEAQKMQGMIAAK